ncbi:fatty acid CoA ligase family protein [Oscillochloris sp. ZM17-4]|uniref:fatty acid CoA ligase family protein n=1 Tax=Oscillochloris sp. ZM17-4 TaxID=2866714 RepID=UPI00351CC14C
MRTDLTEPALDSANIARYLPQMAAERPDQVAVVAGAGRGRAGAARYQRLSFAELDQVSDRYAWGLAGVGIGRGVRVLLLVPAGLPLISLTFALFKVGAVPVLIDPAMGRRNLAQCIEECQPEAMVGVARGHLARLTFRQAFRTVRRSVMVGSRYLPLGDVNLADLSAPIRSPFPIERVAADELAAILFTTGSTGVPKGVLYEYGMFEAQIRLLRQIYHIEPGEVEMPAFPLFALFNVALGATSAIPPIDPTRPASCDPAEVIGFMQDLRVTSTFGSPAIWEKVTAYCVAHGVTLPHLRRVLMAGAPVPPHLHERFRCILSPSADTHTPYGATEALPIASGSGREVLAALAERADPTAGTCVGRPAPEATLKIIGISDAPIPTWDDALALPPFQVGEICVKGPSVTKAYVNRPQSTALAKIHDGAMLWHRMGDLGYLDDQGRLWFYGRKSHRVETAAGPLYTEPVELVFNQHPAVFRSALVGVRGEGTGDRGQGTGSRWQEPVVIVELRRHVAAKNQAERDTLFAELRALGAAHPMTAGLDRFMIHPAFPVDIRHNAKIFREKLAIWAESSGGR